jgi:hypothetical protein
MDENISLFINPQSKLDGAILREASINYDSKEPSGNIEQIDGIVVSMKDWVNVSKGLQLRQSIAVEVQRPIHDRELIIDPDLAQLFGGFESNAKILLDLPIFSFDTRRAYRTTSAEKGENKLLKQTRELYPTLDKKYVKQSLEFQHKENASVLVSPSPPITSGKYFDTQLQKMLEMNEMSRLEINEMSKRGVDSERINKDLMNILTIDPRILELSEAKKKLLDAVLTPPTNLIGIKLLNLDTENISQAKEILDLIQGIKQRAATNRVYLFNVLEFGYIAYCYGVNTVVMPMAVKSPYIRIRQRFPIPRWGTYYHPVDMICYTRRELLAETRTSYRFPCHCKACTTVGTIPKIRKASDWNRFRRIHFLLAKNMDIVELRSTTAPLDKALLDKFSRSKQTMWIPLLQM